MAKDLDVRQDVWVPPSRGIRREPTGAWVIGQVNCYFGWGAPKCDFGRHYCGWGLFYSNDPTHIRPPSCVFQAKGADAKFDSVVIAHNGKCAEKLSSSIPAAEVQFSLYYITSLLPY